MMKFNKKTLAFGIIGFFALALVTAAIISNYATIVQVLGLTQPIVIVGEGPEKITGCYSGDVCDGEVITITNNGENERLMKITNDEEFVEEITDISYVGTLALVNKDTTTWDRVGNAYHIITYTVVGDTFEVSGVPEGHTLIYYKDNIANEDDEDRLVTIGKIGSTSVNLPHANDWNAGELANYCGNANTYDDYDACRGAKLWAVPDGDIVGGELTWANMDDYWYETNLIQYNSDGEIIVYGDGVSLSITPEYTTHPLASTGDYTITTEINPVTA